MVSLALEDGLERSGVRVRDLIRLALLRRSAGVFGQEERVPENLLLLDQFVAVIRSTQSLGTATLRSLVRVLNLSGSVMLLAQVLEWHLAVVGRQWTTKIALARLAVRVIGLQCLRARFLEASSRCRTGAVGRRTNALGLELACLFVALRATAFSKPAPASDYRAVNFEDPRTLQRFLRHRAGNPEVVFAHAHACAGCMRLGRQALAVLAPKAIPR